RLLLYGENEFLLSSFFDDKAKYSCLKNNGSIAETLTVYVSYLLVLKQLDVKNKLADKICVAFSLKNGCNAALESSVSKLFGILL
ncbi:hypothetical protein, partial [Parabacteroides merdae]|uniref:hypothetical protein n=5 Tax=Parabacteroides merdae TaxID=46503 RepID=UPI001959024E